MRNLKSNELNRLEISNLTEFLLNYCNNTSYYATPFGILHDLENQVIGVDNPAEHIMVEYKPNGFQIFYLEEIKEVDLHRVVVYKHTGGT